jgi:hypothetical protein
MKAMKLVLVAILVAGTMACLATTETKMGNAKKVVHTTLVKALQDTGLKAAMQAQLNPGFLGNDFDFYTATVIYRNVIYKITGTKAEWKAFFAPVHTLPKLAKIRIDG